MLLSSGMISPKAATGRGGAAILPGRGNSLLATDSVEENDMQLDSSQKIPHFVPVSTPSVGIGKGAHPSTEHTQDMYASWVNPPLTNPLVDAARY